MIRRPISRSILALAAVLGLIVPAAAEAPVAVVEDVKGKVTGAEFMDYVAPGTRIELGSRGSIVLGYMTSCRRETITGGTVTVGAEQSTVDHGKVERAVVDCDAGHIQLTEREASQSAATVFRNLKPTDQPVPPQITLYGRSPVVETSGAGTLLIERIDQPGERHDVALGGGSLVRGRFCDLAKAHIELTPGATYLATLGAHRIVFKVDARAPPGPTPIIGRLLRLVQAR